MPMAMPRAGRASPRSARRPANGAARHARGADQGEDPDRGLGQSVLADQLVRDGGPERREGAEEEGLADGPAAQDRLLRDDGGQGAHQGAVRVRVRGGQGWEDPPQARRQHEHQPGRDEVDAAPADGVGQEAGHGPGQEDAEQQAAHDPADEPSACPGRRQPGGDGHEDLGHRRGHADGDAGHEEQPERRCQPRGHQGDGGAHQHAAGERVVLEQVAQRQQDDHPDRISELRRRDDHGGRALADPERARQQVEQRLGVVEVGRGQPAGDGQDRADQVQASRVQLAVGWSRRAGRVRRSGRRWRRAGQAGSQ